MGPCLDVYALSQQRDRATIERFIANFVSDLDPLGFVDVSVLPLNAADDVPMSDWDLIPLSSVDDLVALGLSNPPRAFTAYLRAAHPWCGAILCFASTNEVTFGVSVDDPLDSDQAMATAASVLDNLCAQTAASHGWVIWESPPSIHPHRDRPWDAQYIRTRFVRTDA